MPKTFSRDLARANLKRGEGEEKMATENSSRPLKHYTSIKNLFKILDAGYLLLSSPEKWDDINDQTGLQAFCRLKGKGIKAGVLSFANGEESIHHWEAFDKDKNGDSCAISFDRDEILKQAKGNNFLCKGMTYKQKITAKELKNMDYDEIPFLKLNQFKCESEYRIIWFGKGKVPRISFKREAIKRITLSPKIPKTKCEKLQDEIEKKYGIKPVLARAMENGPWIRMLNQLGRRG